MHKVIKFCGFLFLVGIHLLVHVPVLAQTTTDQNSDSENVVRRVRFSGNHDVKDRVLENLVRTKTNREFLAIPRFTPWYFFWNVSNGRFGEAPSLLDRTVVVNDMERISLYYQSLGYREVKVDTTIVEYRRRKTEVSFIINEGEPSRIQSLAYSGFPFKDNPEQRRRFFIESPLTKQGLNDSTYQVNRQFNAQELKEEQERIISYLENNGYAAIERDSVVALVRQDSINSYNLDVLYKINPGSIYRFGEVRISLADNKSPDVYDDSLVVVPDSSLSDSIAITLEREKSSQTKLSLLSDRLLFEPGQLYNEDLYLKTVKEFQNLGNLYIRRFGQSKNRVKPDYSKPYIPAYFDLQTLTKHSISTELFGMKRYGFGTGFGVDYTNKNVFGKAEQLTIGANVSLEFVSSSTLEEIAPDDTLQSTLFRSYELRTDYSVPRLAFPFSFLDNTGYFTSGITRASLAYSQSDQLYFDINSDVRFNYRFEVQHNTRFSSFLDLIELDIIDTNPSQEFKQSLIDDFGENSFEYIRILQDFEPQISSILRYTLRSQNTDLIKRNFGYYSEYAVSVGGNIPYLFDRFVVTPGTLEGNLPALFKLSDNTLTYSRFVKFTADYRKYYPLSPSSVFAWRLYAGFAHPYGENTSIPLNRRFFAGGSNDIRGWAPFQLGPGNISSKDVTINGGEIKLAAYTEARNIFIRSLLGANWHGAWFVDAGNIWYGPRNDFRSEDNQDQLEQGRFHFDSFYEQIAVGSGLGIRIDWQYVVVRLDLAFRVHDLDVGWFNNRKAYFSFGIGHSF